MEPTGSLVVPGTSSSSLVKSRPLIGNSAASAAAMVPPVVSEVVSTCGTSALTSTCFLHLAGGKPGVGARRRSHVYRDLVQRGGPVSLFLNGNAVGAQRQFGCLIFALIIGGYRARQSGARAEDSYLRPSHDRAGSIRYRPLNASAKSLPKSTTYTDVNQKNKHQNN